MSNIYSTQILKDDTQHVIIKITAKFDGTGDESNTAKIVANSFYGALATNGFLVANTQGGSANTKLPYYGLSLYRAWYDINNANAADVELYWQADTPATLLTLSGGSEYDGAGNWITIPNPTKGTANSNGDIGINTRGMLANNSYTILLELRKHNEYYQRGQFNDPAAFNYGPYGIKP